MKNAYLHTHIPEIATDFVEEGDIVVRALRPLSESAIMDTALMTVKIALRLGIFPPKAKTPENSLPYQEQNDSLVFPAPLIGLLAQKDIYFLRGWKQFDSCIKGFNALGLMADQVIRSFNQLASLSPPKLQAIKMDFLSTRKSPEGSPIFSKEELPSLNFEELMEITLLDIALWSCFAQKTIVCSTSSNMGISIHQALRYMQQAPLTLRDKTFKLLNQDEGGLIIWCPDENADFMNKEKTTMLRSLEAEKPPLTRLRTYINRQQRDPGALRDALLCGGYFFPTNPQSREEVQNLLFFALTKIANEKGKKFVDLLEDPLIQQTLASLKCEIDENKVVVNSGIEGGISGLMVPYLLMLEEILNLDPSTKAVCTWNQASIGAALAAAVMADMIIRNPSPLSEETRSDLNSLFPALSQFIDSKTLGKNMETRIHGIFDIANLQSLAQLLGVVVEKHLSGRGTAYVGLGSSSYSNGNRCYEILKESMDHQGPFNGKSTFHPATHTLNPFAQALIYGEDLYRSICHPDFQKLSQIEKIDFIQCHVKKPEPAGAAALAGYLLTRLDKGTLSVFEIAWILKLMGFSKNIFMEFCRLGDDELNSDTFMQEAQEEGQFMAGLARNILLILDWPFYKIDRLISLERNHSNLKYNLNPIDDRWIEHLNPKINIYITGDNTNQPGPELITALMDSMKANQERIEAIINSVSIGNNGKSRRDLISLAGGFFSRLSLQIHWMDNKVNRMTDRTMNYLVAKKVKKLATKVTQIKKLK